MALTFDDIREEFWQLLASDKQAMKLYKEIEAGRATYATASAYSVRVGECLAKILKQHAPYETIEEWDIDDLIPRSLGLNHNIVSKVCETVQQDMNKDARLGIRYQAPKFDGDRAYGIVQELRDNPEFTNIEKTFYDQITNFTQNVVDDAIRANAGVMSSAGVKTYVIRTAEAGACKWCYAQEGRYPYDEVAEKGSDVWRRHENCHCTIDYVTERNGSTFSQRVNNYKN